MVEGQPAVRRTPEPDGPRRPRPTRVAVGVPIRPRPGPLVTIAEITGNAVIAFRETVGDLTDPATRVFIGDTAGRHVGDTFDSHHKVNGMPCGVWTVIAEIETGRLIAGDTPAGTGKLRVNILG